MTYEYQAFPAWRYNVDGGRVFEDQAEIDAADGDWFDTPDFVVPTSDERTALVAEAAAKGIAIDGRWGVKRIREALNVV